MLQGIWIDAECDEPSFKVEGDTIFYPDTTSMPVHFAIIGDSLVLNGVNTAKYKIVNQSNNVFEFRNNNGENVKLTKSDDNSAYSYLFERKGTVLNLNQNKTIKRDTIVTVGEKRFHCYTQINPSTYKVYRTAYNDDGVEVDNVYYDNSVHISIFDGANKLYSHDFHKNDFAKYVPKDFLPQSILSDIVLEKSDTAGIEYQVQLCIPDSPANFIIKVIVSYQGSTRIEEY